MTEGRASVRVRILATLVAFMFASLVTRLWFLQVLAAEKYRSEVSQNAVRTVEVPAARGWIVDDRGRVLVRNRTSLVVTVNRQEMGSDEERVLYELAKILGISTKDLAQRVDDPRYYVYQPVPVAADVSLRKISYIAEHRDQLPGVGWVQMPVRTYPFGELASHVLGYLGQISASQLKDPTFAGYDPGDIVGQYGVERQYEQVLRGTKGVIKYRVNSAGDNLGQIGELPPRPGDNLQLTIDARIQQIAEQSLKEGITTARGTFDSYSNHLLKANAGAVVVMDPSTGAIKALASYPTFDPSLFVRGMSSAEYKRNFGASKDFPLLDRAIQGEYPAGSTYKPFVALSALRDGLATQSSTFPCVGSWAVPKDPLHETFDNWTSYNLGYMNLAHALWESCDTIFYPFGFRYWQDWYPTRDRPHPVLPLQRNLRALGFGSYTGVDIPFERSGLVPDPMWKARVHKANPTAYPEGATFPADFILMTIGQGETLVTPLQLATAYSTIANDGRPCWPHVAENVRAPNGRIVRRIKPRCGKPLPFSQSDIRYVRSALASVPTQGTAASAFVGFPFSQVSVEGKTGTAQVAGKQDYSWFAAMTQGGGKQYVIVALVEQGGHGSTTAAPIVRKIIEGAYGLTPTPFHLGTATDR